VVKTAFECLAAAVDMVRPGTMYRDLGKTISKTATTNGCSVVRTYCGHGIGSLFHTAPNVPHYAKNKAKGVMQAGHIFTIEPMINEGVWQDQVFTICLCIMCIYGCLFNFRAFVFLFLFLCCVHFFLFFTKINIL
jgi:methionine aminopeptidase